MDTSGTADAAPRKISTPLRLVCTEVWGGNRPIDAPVALPGIRGRIYSRPCAGGRGGDIHYLAVCNSGLISRICLADVFGHGEAVATVSTAIHDLLRRYIDRLDQRRVLAKLNGRLAQIGFSALTTAAAVTYFPPWRRLSVSYAGHPPGWLYRRAADCWTRLESDSERLRRKRLVNLPLAADADTSFTRTTLRVAYGDRLLLLTDGLLEAPKPSGQQFGIGPLEEVLYEQRRASADDLAGAIVDAVTAWATDGSLSHDDVTLLLIEFESGPPGPAIWNMIKNRIVRPHGNSADELFADRRHPAATMVSG